MTLFIDRKGQKFNLLTALSRAPNKNGYTFWHCLCECGNQTTVSTRNMVTGHTKSCGCALLGINSTHGMSGTLEYHSWLSMKARCHNPTLKSYCYYGGRGISVCDRWHQSFQHFYADMGPRSENLTLERIDNGGDYEPGNYKWATRTEQNRNKRISKLNTTGMSGVLRRPNGKYLAGLRLEGEYHHLYYGDSLDDACAARKAGEAKYWSSL